MDSSFDWQTQFQAELLAAEAARKVGNEGKARVCARRAAGIVVGEYFNRRGIDFLNPSAYERLRYLVALPEIPQEVRQVVEHLLVKVNEEYVLPIQADLIADAWFLSDQLLRE